MTAKEKKWGGTALLSILKDRESAKSFGSRKVKLIVWIIQNRNILEKVGVASIREIGLISGFSYFNCFYMIKTLINNGLIRDTKENKKIYYKFLDPELSAKEARETVWIFLSIVKLLEKNNRIGYKQAELVLWLYKNKSSIPDNYRAISASSGISIATTNKVIRTLLLEGMIGLRDAPKNFYVIEAI